MLTKPCLWYLKLYLEFLKCPGKKKTESHELAPAANGHDGMLDAFIFIRIYTSNMLSTDWSGKLNDQPRWLFGKMLLLA